MQRNTASLMKKGSIILLFSFLFFDSFCEALQFKGVILSRNVRIQCYYFLKIHFSFTQIISPNPRIWFVSVEVRL